MKTTCKTCKRNIDPEQHYIGFDDEICPEVKKGLSIVKHDGRLLYYRPSRIREDSELVFIGDLDGYGLERCDDHAMLIEALEANLIDEAVHRSENRRLEP